MFKPGVIYYRFYFLDGSEITLPKECIKKVIKNEEEKLEKIIKSQEITFTVYLDPFYCNGRYMDASRASRHLNDAFMCVSYEALNLEGDKENDKKI